MLVSYNWLNELVSFEAPVEELAETLSTTGIEVESITRAADGLSHIVVGKVLTCTAIPETHLHLCQVDTGDEEPRQIVCGASNVTAGIKVMVALPGARIADNYKIKKGKIRGHASLGMICSLAELGLSETVLPKGAADGIHILPEEARVGDLVFPYLGMDDAIIELAITPNRADALSMQGVAHEVAAIYKTKPHFLDFSLTEQTASAKERLSVCSKTTAVQAYHCRVLENITVAPSPQWLQNRLMNAGIRPINNVVDVTNYALLYFGQPMHAYDYDQLADKTLTVRKARPDETLVTLDDEKRTLTADDLVISTKEEAIGLAGVMGGKNTEITEKTQRIVLETAVFEPTSIRKTSNRLNLRSESSTRFEKGINRSTVVEALDFAADLLSRIAGASVLKGMVSISEETVKPIQVVSHLVYLNTRLGTDLSYETVAAIMSRLGFSINGDANQFTVTVPLRRWDITMPADLVEEVARLYGYDKLPSRLSGAAAQAGCLTKKQTLKRQIRHLAEGLGLTEVITYSLTRQDKASSFTQKTSPLTQLLWPMSEERTTLRQNLISGMLDTLAYNIARQNTNLAFYELGTVFDAPTADTEGLPQENLQLAFVLTGQSTIADFQTAAALVDFYDIKGLLETFLLKFNLKARFEAVTDLSGMHPGRTAAVYLDQRYLGFVGQIHPQTAKEYGITETYVTQIDFSVLLESLSETTIFEEISKYPAVSRDIAFVVEKSVTHQAVLDTLLNSQAKYLSNIQLFDIYEGDRIAKDSKSMAYNVIFQNPKANLTDEVVNKSMARLIQALEQELGAVIR